MKSAEEYLRRAAVDGACYCRCRVNAMIQIAFYTGHISNKNQAGFLQSLHV